MVNGNNIIIIRRELYILLLQSFVRNIFLQQLRGSHTFSIVAGREIRVSSQEGVDYHLVTLFHSLNTFHKAYNQEGNCLFISDQECKSKLLNFMNFAYAHSYVLT